MKQNLNCEMLNTDGYPEARKHLPWYERSRCQAQEDYSTPTVVLKNHEARLVQMIREADAVVGCVAWLTSAPVLAALASLSSASIVVQKEDFLRPDGAPTGWEAELRRAYAAVPGCRYWCFDAGVYRDLSCGQMTGDGAEGVRCAGYGGDRMRPKMHHKFCVFLRSVKSFDYNYQGEGSLFEPYAVWTGSYNWTATATRSLENAVILADPASVAAFYAEWAQVFALSEPLDWDSAYVEPEFRIGT